MQSFQFDVLVIGAGTAGLVSAFVADSLGARVGLVESDKIGGECLWRGCVPSKTLVRSAKIFELVKRSEEFGIHLEKPRVVWNAVRLRIQDVQDEVKKLERAELSKSGIEILKGRARFLDSHALELEDSNGEKRVVTAQKFIVATGSKPRVPEVQNLEEVGFLLPHDLFSQPSLPRSLLFLGGGPIACEMAQAMQRLGAKVTIVHSGSRLLEKEEPDASELIESILRAEGVEIHLEAHVTRAEVVEDKKSLFWGEGKSASASHIVLSAGKVADLESLDLNKAGVEVENDSIRVNDRLQTSASHIFACGDVLGRFLFTHVAEHEGKIAGANAVLPSLTGQRIDYSGLVWVTFCDPEIAHVGQTFEQAQKEWGEAKKWDVPYSRLDRALIEGETAGFCRVITTASGRIVGGHIIGPSAGETIAALVPAVRSGALIHEFAEAMFPYPTLSEVVHKAGNAAYSEVLDNEWVQKGLKWLRR